MKILQNRRVKLALEIGFILLMFFAIRAYLQRDLAQGEAPLVAGVLLNGQSVNLENYRGRPVLLHFWATWCGVCKLEQNSIDAISKDHPVIAIAMNSGSEPEVRNYLRQHQLGFPVLVDELGEISQRYGVRGVPTSFIVDPQGDIVFTETGYTTAWGLRLRLWLAGD